MLAKDFDQVNVFTVFLITPLIYLGGVFYSVDMLPTFWQKIALFNPLFYLVDSFRYAFIGISDSSVILSVLIATILAILFTTLNLYLMKKGYKLKT